MTWTKNEPILEVYDGDEYLVALKVRDTRKSPTEYYWEYHVAVIRVDEDTGASDMEDPYTGDDIGWTWDDVEYFIPIKDLNPEPPTAAPPTDS